MVASDTAPWGTSRGVQGGLGRPKKLRGEPLVSYSNDFLSNKWGAPEDGKLVVFFHVPQQGSALRGSYSTSGTQSEALPLPPGSPRKFSEGAPEPVRFDAFWPSGTGSPAGEPVRFPQKVPRGAAQAAAQARIKQLTLKLRQ